MKAAADDIPSAVADTMAVLLSLSSMGAEDDFFLSGGDSLRAVELISHLVGRFAPEGGDASEELGGALLVAVFDEATPAALGAIIGRYVA